MTSKCSERVKKTRLRGIERKFSFRNHWHGIKSVAIAQSSVHTCSPVGTKLQAPAFGPSLPEPCIRRPYTLVIKRKLFSVLVWRKGNNCWKSNLFQFRKLYFVALDEEAEKINKCGKIYCINKIWEKQQACKTLLESNSLAFSIQKLKQLKKQISICFWWCKLSIAFELLFFSWRKLKAFALN